MAFVGDQTLLDMRFGRRYTVTSGTDFAIAVRGQSLIQLVTEGVK